MVRDNELNTTTTGRVKTFSCKEIAEVVGVSEEEIQAIEDSALKKFEAAGISSEAVMAYGKQVIKEREEDMQRDKLEKRLS